MRPCPGLPPWRAFRFQLQLPASLLSRPDDDDDDGDGGCDDEQCQLTTTHFLSTPAGLQIPPRDAAAAVTASLSYTTQALRAEEAGNNTPVG